MSEARQMQEIRAQSHIVRWTRAKLVEAESESVSTAKCESRMGDPSGRQTASVMALLLFLYDKRRSWAKLVRVLQLKKTNTWCA
mmetsp:Transcript_156647/g.276670  ORF Transcript_156647/g.276670 Transcript_156647/m.276670 type:complete len:84 (-) Transcript_156647:3-254(-)